MLKGWPLYPFLLAIWPPLALAAKNPQESLWFSELTVPLMSGLGVAAVSWFVARRCGSGSFGASIAATVVGLSWWGFRPIVNLIRSSPWLHAAGLTSVAVPLAIGLPIAIAAIVARNAPREAARAVRFLTATATILVAFAFARVLSTQELDEMGAEAAIPIPQFPPNQRPDFYLIILDAYTGPTSLLRRYGFDNNPFLTDLRGRGFVIPEPFYANYVLTPSALAGLLNWDYIQNFALDLDPASDSPIQLLPWIEESRTWRFFHQAGYKTLFLPGMRSVTGRNRYATHVFQEEGSDFRNAWQAMTPWPEIRRVARRLPGLQRLSTLNQKAVLHDIRFERLAQYRSQVEGPLFVFAHFILPHDPYVYNSDCSHRVPPLWPWFDRSVPFDVDTEAYLHQLHCANQKVLSLIDELLGAPGPPPLIAVLSDHGRSSYRFTLPEYTESDPDEVGERIDAFGAFLVPEDARMSMARSHSPITSIRTLLTEAYGLDLPRLTDHSYWSSHSQPYRYTVVPVDETEVFGVPGTGQRDAREDGQPKDR